MSRFEVPYAAFADFSRGPVNLYISQAFSNSESAIDRTSDFSPPYSILFNAVQHNYAII